MGIAWFAWKFLYFFRGSWRLLFRRVRRITLSTIMLPVEILSFFSKNMPFLGSRLIFWTITVILIWISIFFVSWYSLPASHMFIFTTIGTICMYNGEGDNYYRRGFFQFMYIHNHLKYDVTQNIISSHNAISYLNWILTALLGHMVCICGSAFATHINMSRNL